MRLEDYFDFLAPDDIRLKGHRIGIEIVLSEYVYRERTPEQILRRFPTLSLEQIYATILYYLHNKEAVSRYLTEWINVGRRAIEEQQRTHPDFVEKVQRLRVEEKLKKKAPA